MNTGHKLQVIVLSALLLLSLTVGAEQTVPGTVEEELHALSLHSGETVKLLRRLVSQRAEEQRLKRLQVAVLALQLRSNAIGDVESRIRTLEDRATEVRNATAQLEAESKRIDDLAQDDRLAEEGRTQLQATKTQIETQIELAARRLWSLESQIVDLQNELAAMRRDVDALEEIVAEGLGDL